MERRKTKRVTVNLRAERVSASKNASVFIENLSENGIYMITAPARKAKEFIPGSEVDLKLKISGGSTIKLRCNVKWSYDNSPDDLTNSVGLEIIDPPMDYRDFVKRLH